MIYLKQFLIQEVQKCKKFTSEEKQTIPEVEKVQVLKCKNTGLEVKNLQSNKNNINNTISDTESNLILSGKDGIGCDAMGYAEIIKKNLEMNILRETYPNEEELIQGIYQLILETVLCKNERMIIASGEYPTELVRSKFLKLNYMHICYVIDCMRKNTSKVKNIKKYLLTALFNAPSTISSYYQAEVNYDFVK